MMVFVCAVMVSVCVMMVSLRVTATASTSALLVSTARDIWSTMIGSLQRGGKGEDGRGGDGLPIPSEPHLFLLLHCVSLSL
jgi:hypothetical protein